MELHEAIKLLIEFYEEAIAKKIEHPVTWALHRAWEESGVRIYDRNKLQ